MRKNSHVLRKFIIHYHQNLIIIKKFQGICISSYYIKFKIFFNFAQKNIFADRNNLG